VFVNLFEIPALGDLGQDRRIHRNEASNDYDRAIQLLIDLRDLATRDKRENDFRFGLGTVREENASKPSLQRRLNEAGFADERAPSLPLLED
jgi:hypothetical protein